MGPNEGWMVNVESELKRSRDQLTNLAINQLASQSQRNFQLPSRTSQPDQSQQEDELIWIQLTDKIIVDSQILYSWKRQIKIFGPSGYVWIDTGEASTFVEYPATSLNNENVATGNGKRYPAKWNPDTSQWIFFLRSEACESPDDPNWPCSLFAFHGIFEYGYLDSEIGTINPSVVDKDSIASIQDFRVSRFIDTDGVTRQFRGASGWYFQAAASTSEVRINNTANDERDITNRSSWGDVVNEWDTTNNLKPIGNLFLGLTTFGGYLYGTRDPDIGTGSPYYPRYLTEPGPIRMTYLYGDANTSNNCRMNFELRSACKARLKGTTQAIPDWASSGSLLSDNSSADISIIPGTDNFIVLDGLRAIRIRPLGWLAHMADHAIKTADSFNSGTFPGGMTMVWKENSAPFAYDDGDPLGDFTPQYTTANGTTTYGSSLEWTGFHHYNFGNWSDTTLGAPDRYNLKARAKVWYKLEDDSLPSRPDIFKVNIGTTHTPPDEIVEVTATERQTVHEGPSGPPFNDPPTYANNPGFVFTFSETVDRIAWIHLTFHYNDQIIGCQFWGGNAAGGLGFPVSENYNNAILFSKINSTDQVTDDFSASLVAMPFGTYANSPLPKAFLAVTNITGTRFRKVYFRVVWTAVKPSGTTHSVDYGDGSTDTGITSDAFDHTYDTQDENIFRAILTVSYTGGSFVHGTTVKI